MGPPPAPTQSPNSPSLALPSWAARCKASPTLPLESQGCQPCRNSTKCQGPHLRPCAGEGIEPQRLRFTSTLGTPLEPPSQTDGRFGRHLLRRSNWKLRPAAAGGLATPGVTTRALHRHAMGPGAGEGVCGFEAPTSARTSAPATHSLRQRTWGSDLPGIEKMELTRAPADRRQKKAPAGGSSPPPEWPGPLGCAGPHLINVILPPHHHPASAHSRASTTPGTSTHRGQAQGSSPGPTDPILQGPAQLRSAANSSAHGLGLGWARNLP